MVVYVQRPPPEYIYFFSLNQIARNPAAAMISIMIQCIVDIIG